MGTLAITIFPGGRPSAPYRHAESHQFTRCIQAQWVGPVDDRCDLAGFQELGEASRSSWFRDKRTERIRWGLTRDQQRRLNEDDTGAGGPPFMELAGVGHQRPLG